MDKYVAAVVQAGAGDNKRENLDKAINLVEGAAKAGATFVTLPENIMYVGKDAPASIAESMDGEYCTAMKNAAKKLGIWLHAGSFSEANGTERPYNTTVLWTPQGEAKAVYRKLHMFDIDIPGGVKALESAKKTPGSEMVNVQTDLGNVGLSICYDMRFPELFRHMALNGAEVLVCCACFTMNTGKDHWVPILRTRAIENGCYMIAPAQIGKNYAFACYGKSMIVDPWGNIIAMCSDKETYALAEIDLNYVKQIRQQIPSIANRRSDIYGNI